MSGGPADLPGVAQCLGAGPRTHATLAPQSPHFAVPLPKGAHYPHAPDAVRVRGHLFQVLVPIMGAVEDVLLSIQCITCSARL